MPAAVQIDGLAELRARLRGLPAELRAAAAPIVEGAAAEAFATIQAAYPAGSSLERGMRFEQSTSAGGVGARVRNVAKLAAIYEFGSELRHTDEGWSRGRMPVANVFVPAAIHSRQAMVVELRDYLEGLGLEVTPQ